MMKTNKILSILILLFIIAGRSVLAQQDKSSYAKASEDKPKLRWEYKYLENEYLLYSFKGKEWKKDYGVFKGFEKDAEGVLAQAVRNRLSEDKIKIITWTKIKEGNDFKSGNQFAEGVTGGLEFNKDGNAEGLSWLDCFHLSLPRFVESGLDLWSKDIALNEAIGQKAGQRIKLIGYYSKLGEEVIDGEKYVIIKTEIGGLEKGTYEEKGIFKRMGAEAKIRIEAKSWFSPVQGRVVKMESELKLYENGQEVIGRQFAYRLLKENEIRKLDGIEDEWELVIPEGADTYTLTRDNKIVFARDKVVEEKNAEGKTKKVDKSDIFICDADGKNLKILTEGSNPVVSPDGKLIAFAREIYDEEIINTRNALWIMDNNGNNLKKIFETGDYSAYSVNSEGKNHWSPNNEWFILDYGIISKENESKWATGILSVKTGEFLKIDLPKHGAFQYAWAFNNDFIILSLDLKIYLGFYSYKLSKSELKEMPNFKYSSGKFSPKGLFYVGIGKEGLCLLSFSENGEVKNKEILLNTIIRGHKYITRWTDNGEKLLYFVISPDEKKTKAYLYSLKQKKHIYEKEYDYVFRITMDSEFKYSYFMSRGKLTNHFALYRVNVPRELQEKITGVD